MTARSALVILTICYAVGFVGDMAINSAVGFWYITLNRPVWAVPNWSLVPIWLVFHGFVGGAIILVSPQERRLGAIALLGATLVTAETWAVVLFNFHRLLPALVIAGVLWFITVAATISAGRRQPATARYLVPSLLWLTYALALNGALWKLN